MVVKYEMLENSNINTDVKKGDIVYDFMFCDYGLASEPRQ